MKRHFAFLLALVVVIGAATLNVVQDVVVTGRVLDAGTGQPLSRVLVSIDNTMQRALSGADGSYSIAVPELRRGARITVRVQHLGYATSAVTRRIDGDTVHIDFRIAPAPVALEALELKAQRSAPELRVEPGAAMVQDAAGGIRASAGVWNTESYDHIRENTFRSVQAEPLSTFSIDVDRASYSNVRRMLRSGELPPVDAVRVEELINYFPYAPVPPRGDEPFGVVTEVVRAPWQPRHLLARISLHAPAVELRNLPPNNLVFLIDVSGSMQPANKLPLLRQALSMLVNELRPQDRVALVVYAGNAGLVLESTPGSEKARILEAIGRLEAGGSTAGGAGLRLAYDIARAHHRADGNNRIILATDGDFNVGASSDAEMIRLVEDRRQQGTYLTVLGFGMGNLKDSKLEKLADHGNGNYAYIDDLTEARKVLITELGGTLLTVARDVKVQVEFNPAHVRAYRLVGYENRLLANEDFDNDDRDAGEVGAGHNVTALYEVVPVGVDDSVVLREPSAPRYQGQREHVASTFTNEIGFLKLRYKRPAGGASLLLERPIAARVSDGSDDIRFASAVAAFGMLLRESEHRGNASFDLVRALAADALGADPHGYRREFLDLVETARALVGAVAAAHR